MKIKLSPFAEQDFDIAIKWYNKKQDKLGYELSNEVAEIFERIKINSLQFPKEYRKMQKAVIKRFPYNIFFVVRCVD